MASLWFINKILWEMRSDYTAGAHYLASLKRFVDLLQPTCRPAAQPCAIKSRTIIGILGEVSKDYVRERDASAIDWTADGEEHNNRSNLRWYEKIDTIELFELLSETSRHMILSQLSA